MFVIVLDQNVICLRICVVNFLEWKIIIVELSQGSDIVDIDDFVLIDLGHIDPLLAVSGRLLLHCLLCMLLLHLFQQFLLGTGLLLDGQALFALLV